MFFFLLRTLFEPEADDVMLVEALIVLVEMLEVERLESAEDSDSFVVALLEGASEEHVAHDSVGESLTRPVNLPEGSVSMLPRRSPAS